METYCIIYMYIKEVALRKCAHENNTSEIFLAYKIFIIEERLI